MELNLFAIVSYIHILVLCARPFFFWFKTLASRTINIICIFNTIDHKWVAKWVLSLFPARSLFICQPMTLSVWRWISKWISFSINLYRIFFSFACCMRNKNDFCLSARSSLCVTRTLLTSKCVANVAQIKRQQANTLEMKNCKMCELFEINEKENRQLDEM